jgi:hypothetical protein
MRMKLSYSLRMSCTGEISEHHSSAYDQAETRTLMDGDLNAIEHQFDNY